MDGEGWYITERKTQRILFFFIQSWTVFTVIMRWLSRGRLLLLSLAAAQLSCSANSHDYCIHFFSPIFVRVLLLRLCKWAFCPRCLCCIPGCWDSFHSLSLYIYHLYHKSEKSHNIYTVYIESLYVYIYICTAVKIQRGEHTILQPISCDISSPVGVEELVFIQMKSFFSPHIRSTHFPFCKKKNKQKKIAFLCISKIWQFSYN